MSGTKQQGRGRYQDVGQRWSWVVSELLGDTGKVTIREDIPFLSFTETPLLLS